MLNESRNPFSFRLLRHSSGAALLGLVWFAVAGAIAPVVAQEDINEIFPPRVSAPFMTYRGAGWLERPDRETQELPDDVVAAMELKPGDRVADIGCGSGYFTRRMARIVGAQGRAYGVDIQPEMLEIMKRAAEQEGVSGIVPILGEVDDPKLPAGEIDWILLVDVYHEFSEWRPMLEKMRASLAPEGRVALLEYRNEDGTGDHIKPDHRMSVRQVLGEWNSVGFELIDLKEFLPAQHLFVFRAAGGAGSGPVATAPLLADYDLIEAMEKGLVSAEVTGASMAGVSIGIENKSGRRIVVTSPVGAYFKSAGAAADRIARRDGAIVLEAGATEKWLIAAISADWKKPKPGSEDRFEIESAANRRETARLMFQAQASPVTPEVTQAIAWLALADPAWEDLKPHLVSGYVRGADAAVLAMLFCDEAGIDVTAKRIWDDREQLLAEVRAGQFKTWLEGKMGDE